MTGVYAQVSAELNVFVIFACKGKVSIKIERVTFVTRMVLMRVKGALYAVMSVQKDGC